MATWALVLSPTEKRGHLENHLYHWSFYSVNSKTLTIQWIVLTQSDGLCCQGTSPVQRLYSFTVAITHTKVNAHFHTLSDYFATWVNTVYFLICLILWCNCSVLLWLVGGGGGGGGYIWTPEWDRGGSVSVRLSPPLCFTSCFWGESFSLLPFSRPARDWTIWKHSFCWNWSQAHSWLFCLCCRFILILSCCDNTCLILSDSHVYKSAYMCTHVQYTLFEQSITVTIIDDYTCPFFELSARFFFLSWFPVD